MTMFSFRICDKFRIHSETKKAQKLQDLSQKFLSSPVFERKQVGKVSCCNCALIFPVFIINTCKFKVYKSPPC